MPKILYTRGLTFEFQRAAKFIESHWKGIQHYD